MSLPKYTKLYKNQSDQTIEVIGSVIETDVPVDRYNYGTAVDYDTVQNQYSCRYADSPGAISPYQAKYYYDKNYHFNVPEYIAKGTGKSFLQVVTFMQGVLNGKIQNGLTGTWKSCDYPEICSIEQGMLKSNSSQYWGHCEIQVYVLTNRIVEASSVVPQHREISAGMSFFFGSSTWNSSNNRWNPLEGITERLCSNYINNINSVATYDVIPHMLSCLLPMADRLADWYLSPGPKWNYAETSSQRTYSGFTTSGTDSERWQAFIRNDPSFQNINVSYAIATLNIGRIGTPNWIGNGEVEPEDPWEEPDPYEPVPPGPTPPGPVDPTDPVDPIPEPDYPPIDGTSCGIYKVYKPTAGQLQDIASKLWDPTAWDAIKQMFTNPMDAIFGLAIVPVEPITSGMENVYLGRYNTQVSCLRVSREYVTVDCGSIFINKFYGSYLDQDPYTKFTLYLPYIGELDINADEIMGKTVSVKYHCNVVTGDTVAIVLINNRSCYTAMGNIIRQLPLSQVDFSSVIQTAVSAAATVLTTANSVQSGIASATMGALTENPGMVLGGVSRASNAASTGIANTLNQVASTKLAYKHAGKIGQGAAQMSVQKPFFTVERPNISLPEGVDKASSSSQKRYTGYPANFVDELRNFHGFTIVEECQLNMLGATDAEIAEATSILKGGVIL